MKTKCLIAATILVLIAASLGLTEEMAARQIIEKADDLMRGATSYSELTMKVHSKHFDRAVGMKVWTQDRDKAFILVMSPAKDRGVAFLKQDREMWNYLPNVERTIKIPPSMMSQSWMGSDFTNNDLSRADTMIVDYDHHLAGTETIDGAECWKLELITKPDAPVVWSKIVTWVQKDNMVMRKTEYYDEDGRVARTMETSKIVKTKDGKLVASYWKMINHKKPGNYTEMIYDEVEFDVAIPAGTFTKRNLTRGVR
ncbi:MAG: outer membrane lipoprotein-sorting protein [Candidatus Lernaella stagnicola]|nr:outer membrane lipoprotein-sorting protein [Candidatus Lernaella stagnicola]